MRIVSFALLVTAFAIGQPPSPGITFRAKCIEVYDGDTITVVPLSPKVRIRLLDCWAPEIKGIEKKRGLESKRHLQKLIEGKVVTVRVPFPRSGRFDQAFTFGRVLAHVYDDKGNDVGQWQVTKGYATREKPK